MSALSVRWGWAELPLMGRQAALGRHPGCETGSFRPPVAVLSGLRRRLQGGAAARAARSGQGPGSVLDGEAHGEESAQVEGGDAVVEPVVVLLDPSVGDPTSAAGEPGDRAFDHRAVL